MERDGAGQNGRVTIEMGHRAGFRSPGWSRDRIELTSEPRTGHVTNSYRHPRVLVSSCLCLLL